VDHGDGAEGAHDFAVGGLDGDDDGDAGEVAGGVFEGAVEDVVWVFEVGVPEVVVGRAFGDEDAEAGCGVVGGRAGTLLGEPGERRRKGAGEEETLKAAGGHAKRISQQGALRARRRVWGAR
jgi:hypothetical protein